jgi:hypothetical protein
MINTIDFFEHQILTLATCHIDTMSIMHTHLGQESHLVYVCSHNFCSYNSRRKACRIHPSAVDSNHENPNYAVYSNWISISCDNTIRWIHWFTYITDTGLIIDSEYTVRQIDTWGISLFALAWSIRSYLQYSITPNDYPTRQYFSYRRIHPSISVNIGMDIHSITGIHEDSGWFTIVIEFSPFSSRCRRSDLVNSVYDSEYGSVYLWEDLVDYLHKHNEILYRASWNTTEYFQHEILSPKNRCFQ